MNNIKRIALFIDSDDPGGAETLVSLISAELPKYGYAPEIWHFCNHWLEWKCKEQGTPIFKVPGYRYFKSFITLPIFNLIFARFLMQRKINILHSHLFGAVTGACLATTIARVPHVGTLHDTYTLEGRKKKAYLLRGAALSGTRLIAVSTQMKEYLEGLRGLDGCNIRVIFNGVSLEKFSGAAKEGLRADLGIASEDFVWISVGRLVEIKGYDVLIEAFRSIGIDNPPVKLLIVGEGPEKERCMEMISEKGLKGKISMLGQREDVVDLLKISDGFALASRSEGLSCSIIEAMAAGLPIVATKVGGNAELVKDGISGYLVPADAPSLMSAKMKVIVEDVEKRKKYGKESRGIVEQNFTLKAMLGQYVSLYDSLTNNH